MKQIIYIVLIFSVACNGRLSDEQRKKLKDGMKRNEIRKVSDAQLTDAAFAYGRLITSALGRSVSPTKKDSIAKVYAVSIRLLYPKQPLTDKMEKDIIEAYVEGSGKVQLADNVQKMGTDSLFYTNPVTRTQPDGAQAFNYALAIRMAKRDVVNSIRD